MEEEDSALIRTYKQFPFELARGEGVYVFDTDGERYLDLYGGHAVSLVGHCPPAVVEAIAVQSKKLLFYSNLTALDIRERAAARLLNFSQAGMRQVFFCNSGAEANENALKLAITQTGRSKIVSMRGGFHGRTFLAAAATDNDKWHAPFSEWMGPRAQLEPNDTADLNHIDQDTAAVILEPILSMGGVVELSADYLKALRARCDETGALLIFDEIQTGMGRTGVPFISKSIGVTPDMATTAKGLGGGFPVGALLVSEAIARTIEIGDLGSTFGGNPIAMAAIVATIDVIESKDLVANAKKIGEHTHKVIGTLPGVSVLGHGCLLGLQLPVAAAPCVAALREKGILTGGSSNPNVMRLLPPMIVETEHIDQLATELAQILEEAQ